MEHFSKIAANVANNTREYIQKADQPSGAGCILVHFTTFDKPFVKSYFGEECEEVSFPFPLEENGKMVSDKLITADSHMPYYCGITSVHVQKTAYTNHYGLCAMLVATESHTGNSRCDVTTDGAAEFSGFANSFQFHKCITASVCSRTSKKLLFKVIIAITSEHDEEMSATDIQNRTMSSVANLADCLSNVCGEYCTISVDR